MQMNKKIIGLTMAGLLAMSGTSNAMVQNSYLSPLADFTDVVKAKMNDKKESNDGDEKEDKKAGDYKKIIKDAEVKEGLLTVIFKEKEGKLYFELPESIFNRQLLLSNRIKHISSTDDFVAGQMVFRPLLISFRKDAKNVYITLDQHYNTVDKDDPISVSFKRNFLDPIMKGFKITATHGDNVVIDVTSFFGTEQKAISPLKDNGPLGKLLGARSIKGRFLSDASNILEAKAFEKNVEINTLMTYQTSGIIEKPYTINVQRSIVALPDEPMKPRLGDMRVGYFSHSKRHFSSNSDKLIRYEYIHRWRIEPKEEDLDRYFAGELVEPKQQIVYYVDSAFPDKWRETIKKGIEDWNKAFEVAGFKNAVKALDYPDDPNFDPDDLNHNCFRYATTATANAMGPSYVDPRTGEILNADVLWYHNITSLLHNWRFVQTGAVDPRVRTSNFDDEIMCESIRYAAAHEVGHTMGLEHNMGASYSYPVDSLRSPSFTQKYGTTPSIMDYARNNYVAQPGDVEKGVKLTPPLLGVYDKYAINWGYRLIKDAQTPEEEVKTLNKWIVEKENDPMYVFGAQQIFGTIDPTDLTEDLGDDHIKASDYGISNLKILMDNLSEWKYEDGKRYDGDFSRTYREIAMQYIRYIMHVSSYIGGVEFEDIRQGDNKNEAIHYISREKQRETMLWLVNQAKTYEEWLAPIDLLNKMEVGLDFPAKLRKFMIAPLFSSTNLYRIKVGGLTNSEENYELSEFVDDVVDAIFVAPRRGQLSDADMAAQKLAIESMMKSTNLVPSSKKSLFGLDDETVLFLQHELKEKPCSMAHAGYAALGSKEPSTSFARINFGLPSLDKGECGMIMTAKLKEVLSRYKKYRRSAKGLTKDFYDYNILKIENLLKWK